MNAARIWFAAAILVAGGASRQGSGVGDRESGIGDQGWSGGILMACELPSTRQGAW
jgi:hypothetical protein